MYRLEFQPFIGEKYSSRDLRLLVLGESHHCSEAENCCFKTNSVNRCESFTTNVIRNGYLRFKKKEKEFERWMNTFTRFSNIYSGRKLSDLEAINFWESVVFYNFVQFPMERPRQSPSFENFLLSKKAFEILIEETNPKYIILWGYRLWHNFPKENIKKIQIDKNFFEYYSHKGIKYPILVLPHPASSKLSYKHSPLIRKSIEIWENNTAND